MSLNTATLEIHKPRNHFQKIYSKIIKFIRFFWDFSRYYGEWVSTPVWERSIK